MVTPGLMIPAPVGEKLNVPWNGLAMAPPVGLSICEGDMSLPGVMAPGERPGVIM